MKIRHLDRYKKSSIKSYDKWDDYDQCFCFKYFKTEDWVTAIRSEIDRMEEAIILDVGCGTGRILEPLTTFHPKKLCGMDISKGILKIASKKLKIKDPSLELKCGDAETEIPWEDSCFDYVLVPGVFHHFFRPFDALREVRRVLKNHGKIIVIDPIFPFPLRIIMNAFLLITPVSGDCRFYTLKSLEEMLKKAQFHNILSKPLPWSACISGQKNQ
jgi:ubiquinone/menaquinone biosynthesis C-methylase UbiE